MTDILKELSKYPVSTRLSLNGTIIVGRDMRKSRSAWTGERRCLSI